MSQSNERKALQECYSSPQKELLSDYAFGNHSTESDIKYALSCIPKYAKRILDIGCNIGWLSQEIQRTLPNAEIYAIDSDRQSIEIAKKLMAGKKITFDTQDILSLNIEQFGVFDVIIILNNYQQISSKSKLKFHTVIKQLLSKSGRVILTCPGDCHFDKSDNNFSLGPLEKNKKFVSVDDIKKFANDIDKKITKFSTFDISETVKKNYYLISNESAIKKVDFSFKLHNSSYKIAHIEKLLGVRAITYNTFSKINGNTSILVATEDVNIYSESFIKTHLSRLPGPVYVLQGRNLDHTDRDKDITGPFRIPWLIHKIISKLTSCDSFKQYRSKRQAAYLRKVNARVVLAEYGTNAVKIMDACRMANVPLVVHFHGFDAYRLDIIEKFFNGYKPMFSQAKAIVGVSHAMCQQLLELGAPKDKVHYIPYFVDQTIFQQAKPAEQAPIFLAVGRFVEKKAPYLTILAFAETVKKFPDARLRMIGDGVLLGVCKRLVEALKIADVVTFNGAQNHEYIAQALQEVRCFVQHSVVAENGDCEGTPVAVLEAQASGLPVVATRHTGIADVIINSKTGFIVDESDVEKMAFHMLQIASDAALAGKMGDAGRQQILTKFGKDKTIKKLADIISDKSFF